MQMNSENADYSCKAKKADMEHASRTGLSAAVSKRAKKRQLN